MENTRDLQKFGHREKAIAAKLLGALSTNNDKTEHLGDSVAIEFNPMSACVFLADFTTGRVATVGGFHTHKSLQTAKHWLAGYKEGVK